MIIQHLIFKSKKTGRIINEGLRSVHDCEFKDKVRSILSFFFFLDKLFCLIDNQEN